MNNTMKTNFRNHVVINEKEFYELKKSNFMSVCTTQCLQRFLIEWLSLYSFHHDNLNISSSVLAFYLLHLKSTLTHITCNNLPVGDWKVDIVFYGTRLTESMLPDTVSAKAHVMSCMSIRSDHVRTWQAGYISIS